MTVSVGCPSNELKIRGEPIGTSASSVLKGLTTLAALADTSRSDGSAPRAAATEAIKDNEKRDMSRRHSVARAFKMFRVTKSRLQSEGISKAA
jgi:hypothetical protein